MTTVADKLRAYAPKKLIRFNYHYAGDRCVIGALLGTLAPLSGFVSGAMQTDDAVRSELSAVGLSAVEAGALQCINDRLRDDATRYDLVLRVADLVARGRWTFAEALRTLDAIGAVDIDACFAVRVAAREGP